MQPRNLTPEDAALMGLPVLDHGETSQWDTAELESISLGVLFLASDEEGEREFDEW
ncbi:hypothetical protein [Streptomyces natalensis]|uniref:hypothetical protein n=1 Tax=Streptomyces natalensis TaxID=68242 RepID=UPI000A4B46FD|nr:hypothetical protein [Streptomyces natalensis]